MLCFLKSSTALCDQVFDPYCEKQTYFIAGQPDKPALICLSPVGPSSRVVLSGYPRYQLLPTFQSWLVFEDLP